MASTASPFAGPVMAWTVFTTTFLWTAATILQWIVLTQAPSHRSGN